MLWWEGNICPSLNAALRLDPESNQGLPWGAGARCKEALPTYPRNALDTLQYAQALGMGFWGQNFLFTLFVEEAWYRYKPGRKSVQGVSTCRLVSPVICAEACGQCSVLNEHGAAGQSHPQPSSAPVMALGATLASGHAFCGLSLCHLLPLPAPWWQMWAGPWQHDDSAHRHCCGSIPASDYCSLLCEGAAVLGGDLIWGKLTL